MNRESRIVGRPLRFTGRLVGQRQRGDGLLRDGEEAAGGFIVDFRAVDGQPPFQPHPAVPAVHVIEAFPRSLTCENAGGARARGRGPG